MEESQGSKTLPERKPVSKSEVSWGGKREAGKTRLCPRSVAVGTQVAGIILMLLWLVLTILSLLLNFVISPGD